MKERILARAFELFSQYGIKTISMDAIAADLGISKKTIYKWFADKDELVTETVTTYLQEVKLNCTANSENAVEAFCSTIHTGVQKLMQMHIIFFFDLKKYHQAGYQIWEQFKQENIVQLFQENVSRGIKSGLYRPDVNPAITARLYVGQLQTIYFSDLFPPTEFNLKETYQQNLQHFVLGLVSPEGFKILNQFCCKYC